MTKKGLSETLVDKERNVFGTIGKIFIDSERCSKIGEI